ncbi:MAG TPA: hypothetical protein V6D07_11450 [Trichocoleus sp.]
MPSQAIAQETSVAAQAGLSSDQVEELSQAGFPIAVPTYVPPNFTVSLVEVNPLSPDGTYRDRMRAGYRIVYRQPVSSGFSAECFEIEAALGGIGGIDADQQVEASLPPFVQPPADYSYYLHWSDFNTGEPPFFREVLFSDWIEAETVFYRVTSLLKERRFCDRISPEQANQILESLRYLD